MFHNSVDLFFNQECEDDTEMDTLEDEDCISGTSEMKEEEYIEVEPIIPDLDYEVMSI